MRPSYLHAMVLFCFSSSAGVLGYYGAKRFDEKGELWPRDIPTEAGTSYQLQAADLNNNGIPERFYTIDDKIALIEFDGKPVTELLKR